MKRSTVLVICIVSFLSLSVNQTLFAQTRAQADLMCESPEDLTGMVYLEDSEIQSTGSSVASSIIWDGSAYAVAWSSRDSSGVSQLYFSRITADGTFLIEPRIIQMDGTYNNNNQ